MAGSPPSHPPPIAGFDTTQPGIAFLRARLPDARTSTHPHRQEAGQLRGDRSEDTKSGEEGKKRKGARAPDAPDAVLVSLSPKVNPLFRNDQGVVEDIANLRTPHHLRENGSLKRLLVDVRRPDRPSWFPAWSNARLVSLHARDPSRVDLASAGSGAKGQGGDAKRKHGAGRSMEPAAAVECCAVAYSSARYGQYMPRTACVGRYCAVDMMMWGVQPAVRSSGHASPVHSQPKAGGDSVDDDRSAAP